MQRYSPILILIQVLILVSAIPWFSSSQARPIEMTNTNRKVSLQKRDVGARIVAHSLSLENGKLIHWRGISNETENCLSIVPGREGPNEKDYKFSLGSCGKALKWFPSGHTSKRVANYSTSADKICMQFDTSEHTAHLNSSYSDIELIKCPQDSSSLTWALKFYHDDYESMNTFFSFLLTVQQDESKCLTVVKHEGEGPHTSKTYSLCSSGLCNNNNQSEPARYNLATAECANNLTQQFYIEL